MEPQRPGAEGPAGSQDSPPPLVALQAPAVDSLTGAVLPEAPTAVAAAAAPLSPWQPPLGIDPVPTLLTIAGRRYVVAELPPEARELVDAIRLADLLIAQMGETCQQRRWGLDALVRQRRRDLQAVRPLSELVAAPDPPADRHSVVV